MNYITKTCINCGALFNFLIKEMNRAIKNGKQYGLYCSQKCNGIHHKKLKTFNCKTCDAQVRRVPSQADRSINHFCNASCAAIYNSIHKARIGIRRSKLEEFIEQQFSKDFPNLTIEYNKTNRILNELDLFIPELNAAIEINGIFHYKMIFSLKQFKRTKIIDKLKIKKCKDNNIKLMVVKNVGNFTVKKGMKHYNDILSWLRNTGWKR